MAKVLGNRLQAAFGQHRDRSGGDPEGIAGEGGGDGDDAPARLLPEHLLDGELGQIDEAIDVCRDEQLDVLGRIVRERLIDNYAGVVDQRVDRLKASQGRLDDPGSGCRLGDVAVDEGDAVAGRDLGEEVILRELATTL